MADLTLPPPWAVDVADIVDPEVWTGEASDLFGYVPSADYTAIVSDWPWDGVETEWQVDGLSVSLEAGTFKVSCDRDILGGDVPRLMRALVKTLEAFEVALDEEVTDA